VAARSHTGLERGQNQDSYLVLEPGSARPWALLAVCDGMGGANGGDAASGIAVSVLREVMTRGEAPSTRDALGRRLLHAVEEAARRIFAAGRADRHLTGMGTTGTALAFMGDTLYLAQVGDSRAYVLRDGRLTQVTRDQTLAQLMMERGQLAPEELDSFVGSHIILQALGTAERVDVDLTRLALAAGDVILVCSDGLHGPVREDALRAALSSEPTPADACDTLISLALAAGGPDNVTALVARVTGAALRPPAGPPSPEKARLDEDTTVDTAPVPDVVETPDQAAPAADEAREEVAMGVIARIAAFFRRRRAKEQG
jgi:protein phosphatase